MDSNTERELLDILSPCTRADVKVSAVQYLLGMTDSEEGCAYIMKSIKLLEALLRLALDDNTAIKKEVEKCLINLTASEKDVLILLRLDLMVREVVVQLLHRCLDPKQTDNQGCCILTNMTRVADAAALVADIVLNTQSVGLSCFVDVLCSLHANKGDLYAVSMLLMNLTQVPSIRRGLMAPPSRLLHHLLPFLSHSFFPSLAACRGVVGAIKHCCFEYDFHEWLLSSEVDLLPRLLLPLAGPEEFEEDDMERLPADLQYLPDTKQREDDPDVRLMLVQAVHKLCSTKTGRLCVKDKNTYVIMRELHKWEKCDKNIEPIFQLIDVLIGDEPKAGMEDLHLVQIPPQLQQEFHQEDQAAPT